MKTIFTIVSSWCPPEQSEPDKRKYIPGMCTPLNEDGGIENTLRSLRQLPARDLEVIIIAVASDPGIEEAVVKKLAGVIKSARLKCTVRVITNRILNRLKSRLEEVGFGRYRRFLNTSSLPRQRNLALLLGYLYEADATVILEEGCLIAERTFLKRIGESIQLSTPCQPLGAIGIYGMQPDGGRLFHESVGWRDTGWPKDKLINQTLHKIGKADRVTATPFIFGSKMVIMRSLAKDVCFDPFIKYGTDLDFLLDARLRGHHFTLDRLLTVKAPAPPPRQRWRRYRQDIYRFIHMRYKLTHQGQLRSNGQKLTLQDFGPYPAAFMRFSFCTRAALVNACCFLVNLLHFRSKTLHYLVNACWIPLHARWSQKIRFKRYLAMLEDWHSFIKVIKEDRKVLRDIIMNSEL